MTTDTRSDSAMEYLQADHRRLDGLMTECEASVKAGDFKEAAGIFAGFRQGLTRHIRIEEDLLFPEFEEASGMKGSGPTAVMRYEHVEIVRLLDTVQELFEGPQPSAQEFEQLRSSLVGLLHEHNQKEERILYPMTDQLVPLPRLRELCRKMRSFE